MDAPLEIPFPIPDPKVELADERNEEFDEVVEKRYDFWASMSTVEWFRARGYTLYTRRPWGGVYYGNNQWTPCVASAPTVEADYPFPHHNDYPTSVPALNRVARGSITGTVFYGQNSEGHHVVFKLLHCGSDELRIYELLHRQSLETMDANCVLPILDLIPIKDFCIAVMPRWGDAVTKPDCTTAGEVVKIMHDMLRGLAFLHQHKIAHRDISFRNVLVNHFCSTNYEYEDPARLRLRRQGALSYALIDFNVSTIAPEEASIADFRSPAEFSYMGRYPKPYDTNQGEFDYNPFAFDVGTMGVNFCQEFQIFCRELPFLAPLLDGMTTRIISKRFTAAEALRFLEGSVAELTSDELNKSIEFNSSLWAPYDVYNRWAHVPPHQLQRWSAYRDPPIPSTTRFMRWACTFRLLFRLVRRVRWIWAYLSGRCAATI